MYTLRDKTTRTGDRIMSLTTKDREFLEAVARDTLPDYSTLGSLHRAAGRLIRAGLLESRQVLDGTWTRYSLTPAGDVVSALLASPVEVACKCCVDNECECSSRKTGPVTRTGEIIITGSGA